MTNPPAHHPAGLGHPGDGKLELGDRQALEVLRQPEQVPELLELQIGFHQGIGSGTAVILSGEEQVSRSSWQVANRSPTVKRCFRGKAESLADDQRIMSYTTGITWTARASLMTGLTGRQRDKG